MVVVKLVLIHHHKLDDTSCLHIASPGRQLQYNFTLPLVLAGGAATKFALDNEKAMTRVIKVYGDGSKQFNKLAKTEIPALADAFRALSDEFGVNQAQVIQVAGDWAAAGASGIALAKSTKLTLETMILGELDAAKATESLIAIQAQYGQNTKQLSKTIDILNMTENQTGISMAGLIDGFARTAGVARDAGIDVEHLAAFLAALTPAAGSAANAGQALKTIISRLLAPTKEANAVLGMMGIHTKDLSWQTMNGSQRLETMAKSFNKLADAQKIAVSSVVASRWQINKFDVLMRDITNTNGYYKKSLEATDSPMANFAQRQKELNIVLQSNPQKLKQMWTILQNAMADVIQPLIPYIVILAAEIAKLANEFSNLDPRIQKAILTALAFLAILGPIARYVGSVQVLIGILAKTFGWLGERMVLLVKGPFKLFYFGISMVARVIAFTYRSILITTQLFGKLMLSGFSFIWKNLIKQTAAFSLFNAGVLAKGFLFMLGLAIGFGKSMFGVFTSTAAAATTGATAVVNSQVAMAGALSAGATSMLTLTQGFVAANLAELKAGSAAEVAVVTGGLTSRASAEMVYVGKSLQLWTGYLTTTGTMFETWSAEQLAVIISLYSYLETLQRAYYAASYGLAAGASSSMLALEASKSTELVALTEATTGKQLALIETTGAVMVASTRTTAVAMVATNEAGAVASVGVFRRFFRALVAIFLGFPALILGAFSKAFLFVIGLFSAFGKSMFGMATSAAAASSATVKAIATGQTKAAAALGAGATEMLAIESGFQAQRLLEITAGTDTALAIETSGLQLRAGAQLAYTGGSLQLWTGYITESLTMAAGYSAEYIAMMEALYAYLLGLQAAFFSDSFGIAAGASASMLSLESAAGLERVTVTATQVEAQVLAIEAGQAAMVLATETGGALQVAAAESTALGVTAAASAGAAGSVGIFGRMLAMLGSIFVRGLALLLNPWVLLIAAILGIAYHFRDQIKKIWEDVVGYISGSQSNIAVALQGIGRLFSSFIGWIQKGFYALPASVQSAMLAVIHVLSGAVQTIVDLLSYLNPFAHHSPSLVENVTKGMDTVAKQFSKVKSAGSHFTKVGADLKKFKAISATMGPAPWHDERVNVAKAYKSALPLFDKLVGDWKQMNALLAKQKAAVDAQQAVVDKWAASLDKANAALDRQQAKLDKAQNKLTKLNDAYSAHQAALDGFANAPLKGMKKMDNAIFANDMASKKLRLDMMKWEDANGSIDDMSNRLQGLKGDMEVLRGESTALHAQGAGSDITGPIDAQLAAMQTESQGLADTIKNSPIADMQKQLDDLGRKADELDLEKSLKFDPLTHQIQNMVDTTKELTFKQVTTGIKHEQAAMERLQPKIDAQTAAVDRAQKAVDRATASRDRIQKRYDKESKKLDRLNKAYQKTQDTVQAIEDALNKMGSAASDAVNKLDKAAKKSKGAAGSLTPGEQNFLAGKGANFPKVGGKAKIGRELGMGDQSKMIEKFTQGIQDDLTKQFGKIDMFGPLKDKWNKIWGWLKTNVGPKIAAVGTAISNAFSKINIASPFGGKSNTFTQGLQELWSTASDIVNTGIGWIMDALRLFAPDAKRIWKAIVLEEK